MTYIPSSIIANLLANQLAVGEETLPRDFMTVASAASPSSGQLRLTHWTARKSETITQLRLISGNTAAGATPTLVRAGIYSIAANGDGTLVASTANDTSLFAAANTAYTKALQASWAKVAGQRYALGILVVSGAAMPTFPGLSLTLSSEAAVAPVLAGNLTGQTDLPASYANASLTATGARIYGVVLP